jgi:hypothetical protein
VENFIVKRNFLYCNIVNFEDDEVEKIKFINAGWVLENGDIIVPQGARAKGKMESFSHGFGVLTFQNGLVLEGDFDSEDIIAVKRFKVKKNTYYGHISDCKNKEELQDNDWVWQRGDVMIPEGEKGMCEIISNNTQRLFFDNGIVLDCGWGRIENVVEFI